MAIRQIITALAAALLLISTSVRADECVTIDRFNSVLASEGVTLYGSRAAATKQMEAVLNKNREKTGTAPIEAAIFLVGYMKDDKGEVFAVVGVFDPNGCLIVETFVTLTIKQWFEFLASSGVEPKDFVPLSGA